MKVRGFTIAEALIVLAIIAILSYLLFPLFMKVKRHVQIYSSASTLRQIHIVIENYRQAWDGADVFTSYKSFYRIGLPLGLHAFPWHFLPEIPWRNWYSSCASSPCGRTEYEIFRDLILPYNLCGYISLVTGLYNPESIERGPGNRVTYDNYIPIYRQNIVIVVDPYCNPPGTNMWYPFTHKRGLALLLSGEVVNRYAMGLPFYLQWWSDPPED